MSVRTEKQKNCCHLQPAASHTLLFQRLQNISEKVMTEIEALFIEDHSDLEFQQAWWGFLCGKDRVDDDMDLSDYPHPHELPEGENMFPVWHNFHWSPTKKKTSSSKGVPAEYYLNNGLPNPLEKEFTTKALQAYWCFYQVIDIEYGASLTLKNLLNDEVIIVHEKRLSLTDLQDTILFTTIVEMHGLSLLLGCGSYTFNLVQTDELENLRKDISSKPWSDKTIKAHRDDLMHLYWLFRERILNPEIPSLKNSDDENIELHQLVYDLHCSPMEAFQSMKSLATGFKTDELFPLGDFDTMTGELVAITLPWLKKKPNKEAEWEQYLLGKVSIKDSRMIIDVNSRERANSMKRRVSRRMSNRKATLRIDKIEFADSVIERAHKICHLDTQSSSSDVQALDKQTEWQHWKDWLNMSIPALNGLTPKQASKTANDRRRLEVLLAGFQFNDPEYRQWLLKELELEMSLEMELEE